MALTTYSELTAAVAAWLARSDLTSRIPDFVTLFENAANKRLRVRQMETSTTLSPSSGAASLPSDFLDWRSVTWTGSPAIELEYAHPSWVRSAYPSSEAGTPKYFTIEGSTLTVLPSNDTDLTLRYWEKIDALSDDDPNWLYSAHPDVYLSGSLCEAFLYLMDEERAALWKARRDEAFEEIIRLDAKQRGPSAIRTVGPIV